MRHLISAALYTLTIILMLVLIGVYVIGEYMAYVFFEKFWWVCLLMIGSAVLGVYIGEPERFPRVLQPKHKRRNW